MRVTSLTDAENLSDGGKKLRIAVFNRTFSTAGGGAERYSVALVEQLAARHDIHVYAQEIAHQWPGVTYHRISMPVRKPRWINQLWFATCTWWWTRTGFDVVHSHENTWHGDVQTVHVLPVKHTLFRQLQGWRQVARWVKIVTSPRLLAYLGLEHLRFSSRFNKKIVVTSDSLRAIMEFTYPNSKAMMSVITPGITLPRLPVTLLRKRNARVLLGLPKDENCLLFVANDYRKKGLHALLNALSRCPPDFILAVVGNLFETTFFQEEVRALGLESRVFFLGSLKDVAPAYESADCLAHPTLEDTFAMVVLEAMSYGLPVVVSNPSYCGISGLLQHGKNALIVTDPSNPLELQQALEQALTQPELHAQLSEGALDFAARYQWGRLAQQQESLYQDVEAGKNQDKR